MRTPPRTPQPRPGILDLKPYVPGRSAAPGRRRVIKLSSNESALGPSPKALAAYRRAVKALHRYPEGTSRALREAIAARHALDPARIVCGAGSDEIIFNLARGYAGPGDEVLYTVHGFNIYPIAAHCVGARPVTAPETDLTADVAALLARVTPRTRLVYIANPNNPTGTYLPLAELRRLRAGLPDDVVLVIDAAYAEFVTRNDYEAGVALVDAGENVVMTRTMSKIYGLGGLRVGWAYCPPSIFQVLERLRAPFNVNVAAQAAAVAAVEDAAYTNRARDHNSAWLPWLTERLRAAGLTALPSVANFVLVRFPAEPGRDANAADAFLLRRGIIARETGGYGLADCLRITIGREDEVRAVADALAEFAG